MSRQKNITTATPPARIEPLNGSPYAAADTFYDIADDFAQGANVWREVTPQFARYCTEAIPPVFGPEGSRSFALGECFKATPSGAVHCVIAQEGARYFAKYVNLMLWADELLGLREALECGGSK